jgi:predicted RNase H-like nuclease (RuvC/YqgF family)
MIKQWFAKHKSAQPGETTPDNDSNDIIQLQSEYDSLKQKLEVLTQENSTLKQQLQQSSDEISNLKQQLANNFKPQKDSLCTFVCQFALT